MASKADEDSDPERQIMNIEHPTVKYFEWELDSFK